MGGSETAGNASAGASGTIDGLLDLLNAGGPVVAILLAMSVAALSIILLKLWQFRQARLGDKSAALEALQLYASTGQPEPALQRLAGHRNPVAQTLGQAIRGRLHGVPEAVIREEVFRFGGDILEDLRAFLRPLEVIASLAPLLGLFGTVLGMIKAFQNLAAAGNQIDPSILSGGIWEALLTTAVGLAVAIPSVAALNWLERQVERVGHDLESIVTRVFTENLSESPISRTETQSGEIRQQRISVSNAAIATGE